jgi:hypothetical protein
MKFVLFPLGFQHAGKRVRVDLTGSEANVMLMDSLELAAYRRGGRFTYYGGHTRMSPVVLGVPYAGDWNLVVDIGGSRGSVHASVHLL